MMTCRNRPAPRSGRDRRCRPVTRDRRSDFQGDRRRVPRARSRLLPQSDAHARAAHRVQPPLRRARDHVRADCADPGYPSSSSSRTSSRTASRSAPGRGPLLALRSLLHRGAEPRLAVLCARGADAATASRSATRSSRARPRLTTRCPKPRRARIARLKAVTHTARLLRAIARAARARRSPRSRSAGRPTVEHPIVRTHPFNRQNACS